MKVELIDVMGDDLRVVNAARVSFNKESDWEWDNRESGYGEPKTILSEQDQKLIKYLAKHNHWTPFAHVVVTMREKVPIFVARQRFKHMVGFNYNEVSRRYVDDPPEFFTPNEWRSKPVNAKQGSGNEIITELMTGEYEVWDDPTSPEISLEIKNAYQKSIELSEFIYQLMIKNDVAPEQARMVLPQSMYTEYYCTGSLASWARAYKLRIDGHAQKEIQDLAKMWGEVIGGIDSLKYSWKALTE
jgi:thymidylate synthase (FAD)